MLTSIPKKKAGQKTKLILMVLLASPLKEAYIETWYNNTSALQVAPNSHSTDTICIGL